MKLSVVTLDIFLLIFSMLRIPIPHYLYLVLRYAALVYLFVKYMKTARHQKYIFFMIAGYGVVLVFSTLQNRMGINNAISAFGYIIQIVDTYFLISSTRITSQKKAKSIFGVLVFLSLITDVMILALPYDPTAPAVQYFVGTKFTVSYVHCLMICLFEYYDVNWGVKHKSLYYVLFVWSVIITRLVNCSTGIIMCALIFLLHIIPLRFWKSLCNWKAVAVVSIAITLLLFGEMTILNNDTFINTVTRLFNKNVNLTGRTYIFRYLPAVIARKPWIGYGYYNSVVADYMGTKGANPQNGFMKIIMDSGFFGLAFYIGLMFTSIANTSKHYEKIYPLYIFFYVMLIVSAIEINLTGGLFFLIMAMIYFSAKELSLTEQKQTEYNSVPRKRKGIRLKRIRG